jgi:phage replication-related protein YjqB (UPF0714/DUF867 family)
LPEPRNYGEVLAKGYVPGRDFRISFGDSKLDQCLLVVPHGGGIEPGSSEIMRAVADMGGWAWYEFAGYLRQANKAELHIDSTSFDEPTLVGLLPRTAFVVSCHGCDDASEAIVYVGGLWQAGRDAFLTAINASCDDHGIKAIDASDGRVPVHLKGFDPANLTNRGKFQEGVQLEFSRQARNVLFPPDASREARGKRSARLRSLSRSIHGALDRLKQPSSERLRQTRTGAA